MKNLNSELITRIKEQGPRTFEKYMELCLYWRNGGYYAGDNTKSNNDYYTSPMAHPVFGALITLYIKSLFETNVFNNKLMILEIGAGNYQLANDITNYAKNLSSGFYDSLEYMTIDLRKPEKISNNGFTSIVSNTIPLKTFSGIVILNEVFDAFPFHRIIKHNNELKEIYVDTKEGEFIETYGSISSIKLNEFISENNLIIKENQIIEISLKSNEYINDIASMMDTGVVLNIDYGDTSKNLLNKFPKGSLSCYYKHTMSQNPYFKPGKQDITCHVNFSALIKEASKNNLQSNNLISQRDFLYQQGFKTLLTKLSMLPLDQTEINANRMGMLNLVNPDGLGNFKALIMSKNITLSKIDLKSPQKDLMDNYPIPLLKDYHIDLFKAKYPYQSQNWNELFEIN